ncbi:hypothetical protein RoseRS_2333 [Roseiflexus sp. RS-1]|nr:hypothetical protein RoseRS_2333 [Roseiflexus sp. RS-1]
MRARQRPLCYQPAGSASGGAVGLVLQPAHPPGRATPARTFTPALSARRPADAGLARSIRTHQRGRGSARRAFSPTLMEIENINRYSPLPSGSWRLSI